MRVYNVMSDTLGHPCVWIGKCLDEIITPESIIQLINYKKETKEVFASECSFG